MNMDLAASAESGEELDVFVEAYESALAADGHADLGHFLPPADHPLYHAVLLELVRVDMEFGYTRDGGRPLDQYRPRFPQLFDNPADLAVLTFEEYRLRHQAGEAPTPQEYRQRYGIDPRAWPAPACAALGSDQRATQPGLGVLGRAFPPPGQAQAVELLGELQRSDPASARAFARALRELPRVGQKFAGFHLSAELGRGAFGRVFLARQGELADRPVALKISADVRGESRTLAQLQHTNIVPIYSIHHAGALHAVCMPYLGSVTLADVLRGLRRQASIPTTGKGLVATVIGCKSTVNGQASSAASSSDPVATSKEGDGHAATAAVVGPLKALEGLSYVEAVLSLGARLADGLAHAHERGILHRDLKPANVLLADDGQPLLLDFNLSEDTKRPACASAALVGGTLPYMAPEHLEAFQGGKRRVDARSDIYSLGVLLFELLAGRHPFPEHRAPLRELLPRMIGDRERAPAVRAGNPAVTPAAAAILQHCLEPDPERRYQTARQLKEDLERHLSNQPLRHVGEPSWRERGRKLLRRHPRLAPVAVATLALGMVLALGGLLLLRADRQARLEAGERLQQFRAASQGVILRALEASTADRDRLAEVQQAGGKALRLYGVLEDPAWQERPAVTRLSVEDQEQLQARAGELLMLYATVTALQVDPKTTPAQRAELLEPALKSVAQLQKGYSPEALPRAVLLLHADLLDLGSRAAEAAELRAQAAAMPLRGARDLCMEAFLLMSQGRPRAALPLWEQAVRADPQNPWAWPGLAVCQDWLDQPAQAAASYSACIALHPDYFGYYFKRGLAQLRQQEPRLALADFDQALRQQPGHRETLINRALARLELRQPAEAVKDLSEVLEHGPPAARIYLMRARARGLANDSAGQQSDEQAAQRLQPEDEAAWVARGASRAAPAPQDALADFEQALRLNPRSLPAMEARAHVLARLGRTKEAIASLDTALKLFPEHAPALAGRGTLLGRLGQRDEAVRDAQAALKLDRSPAITFQVAGVYALTARHHAADRDQAFTLLAEALRRGFGYDLLETDHDLDSLREDPRFARLRAAMQALYAPSRGETTRAASAGGAGP
jgi:serine/threonine protein kinase/Tfp pilus assembly protein PilF